MIIVFVPSVNLQYQHSNLLSSLALCALICSSVFPRTIMICNKADAMRLPLAGCTTPSRVVVQTERWRLGTKPRASPLHRLPVVNDRDLLPAAQPAGCNKELMMTMIVLIAVGVNFVPACAAADAAVQHRAAHPPGEILRYVNATTTTTGGCHEVLGDAGGGTLVIPKDGNVFVQGGDDSSVREVEEGAGDDDVFELEGKKVEEGYWMDCFVGSDDVGCVSVSLSSLSIYHSIYLTPQKKYHMTTANC